MGECEVEARPKRRWYQFHLWHLFVLVLIAAIPCSWFACRMVKAKRQAAAVESIQDLGGWVTYDFELGPNVLIRGSVAPDGSMVQEPVPPGPAWLRDFVGVDFLADVVRVSFDNTKITDADLVHLEGTLVDRVAAVPSAELAGDRDELRLHSAVASTGSPAGLNR